MTLPSENQDDKIAALEGRLALLEKLNAVDARVTELDGRFSNTMSNWKVAAAIALAVIAVVFQSTFHELPRVAGEEARKAVAEDAQVEAIKVAKASAEKDAEYIAVRRAQVDASLAAPALHTTQAPRVEAK